LERARHAGVPAVVVSRAKLGAAYSRTLLEILCAYHIDLIVLAGFLTILDTAVIQAYPRRILNVHPSLIPSFCGEGFYGLKVHEAVLAYGVKVTGATVHYVNEIPDGGEIIAQKAVRVLPDDTPETLQQRVMVEAEWVLLPQAVADCCARIAQEEEKTHEMP
ncbi:MAG: formyltransferase family protein, partial [Clostridia bacterium]